MLQILLQAFFVELDAQAARKQRRNFLQLFWIGGVDLAHRVEIDIQAGAIEASLIQILRGANERAGTSANCADQRLEIAVCRRSEEEQHLLRAFRHGYSETTCRLKLLVPCLGLEEPVFRRRIRRATQKRRDQQVMRSLGLRKIRMNDQHVANSKIRNLGDRQRLVSPRDLHFKPGAGKVERSGIGHGEGGGSDAQKQGEQAQGSES